SHPVCRLGCQVETARGRRVIRLIGTFARTVRARITGRLGIDSKRGKIFERGSIVTHMACYIGPHYELDRVSDAFSSFWNPSSERRSFRSESFFSLARFLPSLK